MTAPTPVSVEAREILRQFLGGERNRVGDLWHSSTATQALEDFEQTIRTECAAREAAAVEAETERCAAYLEGQAAMLRNTYDLAAVQAGLPVAEPTFSAYAVEAMAAAIRTPKGADNATD